MYNFTTDGHCPYLTVIEPLFGDNGVDFAMLHKNYGNLPEGTKTTPEHTYGPAACAGIVFVQRVKQQD